MSALGVEYVSMHHRMRKDLHRRLKMTAVQLERPVTDIVNEAVERWMAEHGVSGVRELEAEVEGGSLTEKLEWLREKKEEGAVYAAASALSKSDLIDLLSRFRIDANQKMSADRLVSELLRHL